MKRALVVVVVGVALLLAACKPPTPPGSAPQGIDACTAPSTSAMATWARSSPYTSYGPYIGGVNVACAQPNLTTSWVSTVTGQGWTLLPIWAGAQAPCVLVPGNVRSREPRRRVVGRSVGGARRGQSGDRARDHRARPIYYDLEAYPPGGNCSAAARKFISAWAFALHLSGYRRGDLQQPVLGDPRRGRATYDDSAYYRPDAIWIAAWNNSPNLFGFNRHCALSDSLWTDHQRIHQFLGGHNETWGGVTVNVDVNAVDAPTFP